MLFGCCQLSNARLQMSKAWLQMSKDGFRSSKLGFGYPKLRFRCSVLGFRCLELRLRCSMLGSDVQCLASDVQRLASFLQRLASNVQSSAAQHALFGSHRFCVAVVAIYTGLSNSVGTLCCCVADCPKCWLKEECCSSYVALCLIGNYSSRVWLHPIPCGQRGLDMLLPTPIQLTCYSLGPYPDHLHASHSSQSTGRLCF